MSTINAVLHYFHHLDHRTLGSSSKMEILAWNLLHPRALHEFKGSSSSVGSSDSISVSIRRQKRSLASLQASWYIRHLWDHLHRIKSWNWFEMLFLCINGVFCINGIFCTFVLVNIFIRFIIVHWILSSFCMLSWKQLSNIVNFKMQEFGRIWNSK